MQLFLHICKTFMFMINYDLLKICNMEIFSQQTLPQQMRCLQTFFYFNIFLIFLKKVSDWKVLHTIFFLLK